MGDCKNILVIRLGAFGDIVRSFSTMAAIRRAHRGAKITLLTTPPFEEVTRRSPYFDDVWGVSRWKWTQVSEWMGFRGELAARGFDRVYDLQRNDRTRILRRLAPPALRRQWFDKSLPLPGIEGKGWDIARFPLPDMSWLEGDISRFDLAAPFVLLVPGSAPQHPEKRWPAAHYAALADSLARKGYVVAALGTAAETAILADIASTAPALRDLSGKTSFADIAALARRAAGAVGNDTGPMHLIALAGCPVVSLFSGTTDPQQSMPLGPAVRVLQAQPIGDITPIAAEEALLSLLANPRISPA